MKRRITLSIALALSVVLLTLMKSDSTAKAQSTVDIFINGVVTPSAGQILRVTVSGTGGSDTIRARFKWAQYGTPVCNGMPAVCRHAVVSQGATPVADLNNDALSFDVLGDGNGVNVVVESNSRKVKVNAVIMDSTGAIVSLIGTTYGGNGQN